MDEKCTGVPCHQCEGKNSLHLSCNVMSFQSLPVAVSCWPSMAPSEGPEARERTPALFPRPQALASHHAALSAAHSLDSSQCWSALLPGRRFSAKALCFCLNKGVLFVLPVVKRLHMCSSGSASPHRAVSLALGRRILVLGYLAVIFVLFDWRQINWSRRYRAVLPQGQSAFYLVA